MRINTIIFTVMTVLGAICFSTIVISIYLIVQDHPSTQAVYNQYPKRDQIISVGQYYSLYILSIILLPIGTVGLIQHFI